MDLYKLTNGFLAASAFILLGLVILAGAQRSAFESEADARMVITDNADSFSLLTTTTREGEEALFVLSNTDQRILVYRTPVQRNSSIELVTSVDLTRYFK